MLDMIPSIGPDKAQALWKKFGNERGSLESLMGITEQELGGVVGPASGHEVWVRLH